MNAWRIGAIGIAAYLLILLATFPVMRVADSIEQRLEGVLLRGVSGSLWSGQAAQVTFQGQDIGAMHWQFQPLRLLTGNIEYRIELPDEHTGGSGLLDLSFGGRLHGHDLDLQLPPAGLINRYSRIPVVTGGSLVLHLQKFELPPGKLPTGIQGALRWQGARLSSPMELELGDLALDLASTGDDLVATVAEGGTLGLSGTISLQAGGRYAVDLQLHPVSAAGDEVRGVLDTLMRRLPDGGYQLVASGNL
jgi:general secretion pathway protein N